MDATHFEDAAASIDSLAPPRIVRRGRSYAARGHVLDWAVGENRLEARVQGGEREPYLVSIEWDGEELLPSCSCPFDGDLYCKHAVAALVAASEDPGPDHAAEPGKPRRAEEVAVRRKRGRRTAKNGSHIRSMDGDRYFGKFEVESSSGRLYRVEIRSLRHLVNWCSCPDFSSNLLGTCKHIEAVLDKMRRRAPKKVARLADTPPPTSHVFVRRVDDPGIWLQRGAGVPPARAAFLDRWFEPGGAFRGDAAADFPEFARLARRRKGLAVGEDAVEFAAQAAEEERNRRRSAETAARVLARGGHLPGIRAELYPYQTQGVAFLAGSGRALLADDMGLGKTVQAIAACRWLAREEGDLRALVVCPASLKHQWAREIERFAGIEAVTIQGGAPERRMLYRRRALFTIVNYELVLRDREVIRELAPDVLILDEAQRIRNWRTKTAEAIKSIETRHAFVLTGTPIENRLDDLYSLMQVVDRRILGPLWAYNESFVDLAPRGNRVIGYRNLDRLRERLRPVFLRRERSTVLSQLPERVDNRYYVPLDPAQRNLMEEHVQKAARILHAARDRPLTPSEEKRLMAALVMARMSCNAAGLVDKESKGSPKLDEFAKVLAETCLDGGRKVVVFSEWEKMIRLAAERADRLGIEHLTLSGRVPTTRRGPLLDRFREDAGIKVFFSTDAGGVGLNLQAAQTVINLDLPWNPARLSQRIARVHRMGQPRSVNVVLLIAEDSIETRIERILETKQGLFDAVITEGAGADTIDTKGGGLRIAREIVGVEPEDEEDARPAAPEPVPAPDDGGGGEVEPAARSAPKGAGEGIEVPDAGAPAADATDGPGREIDRVARRRLRAARTLAEAGLEAEAFAPARDAMLAKVRSLLGPGEDVTDAEGLLRAVYVTLLPAGKMTLAQAGALSRIGDLVRAFGDRDLPVPGGLVEQAVREAAEFVEGV